MENLGPVAAAIVDIMASTTDIHETQEYAVVTGYFDEDETWGFGPNTEVLVVGIAATDEYFAVALRGKHPKGMRPLA